MIFRPSLGAWRRAVGKIILTPFLLLLPAAAAAPPPATAPACFRITVTDAATGRGVPLVELETVNNLRYVTDSNGIAAFDELGLMDQDVFFHVRSHGYEFPKDGFGFAGKALRTTRGGEARLTLKRLNIAERLYRITGQGIYRDSVLMGVQPPIREALLNGQVLGQDSVQALVYGGRIHWFWGDTNRSRYPLGHFATSGAVSDLPGAGAGQGGLDPGVGVNLSYFVDAEGFSRKMCPLKEPGMVWVDGLLTVADPAGPERMLVHYARMKSLTDMQEHGLALWNDQVQTLERLKALDLKDQWRCPRGHPLRVTTSEQAHYLFPTPFPTVRVRADLKSVTDPEAYEAFTCLKPGTPGAPGTRYVKGAAEVERDAVGRLVYDWKPGTDPTGQREERELIAAGKIKPEEARFQIKDVDSGKSVEMHGGSVYWNDYRKRYIMIAVQSGGSSSYLGEVWFAESAAPTGPWLWARKIVTHDKYTFYNPKQHPFYDQEGGRVIYFEGTYANTFSGNPVQTPRYDYNQIMYRLDLADPRLGLPLERKP